MQPQLEVQSRKVSRDLPSDALAFLCSWRSLPVRLQHSGQQMMEAICWGTALMVASLVMLCPMPAAAPLLMRCYRGASECRQRA